ncbi:hypothetical protein ACFL6S_03460 [Candidatus Poribacteria bacterium]
MNKKTKALAFTAIMVVAVLFVGGYAASTLLPKPFCNADPTEYECVCPDGQEKFRESEDQRTVTFGCREAPEPVEYDFPLDDTGHTYDPSNKDELLSYTKDMFREECPNCDTIDCGFGFIEYATADLERNGETWAFLECLTQEDAMSGHFYWRSVFNLETGESHPVLKSYCNSRYNGEVCKIN